MGYSGFIILKCNSSFPFQCWLYVQVRRCKIWFRFTCNFGYLPVTTSIVIKSSSYFLKLTKISIAYRLFTDFEYVITGTISNFLLFTQQNFKIITGKLIGLFFGIWTELISDGTTRKKSINQIQFMYPRTEIEPRTIWSCVTYTLY